MATGELAKVATARNQSEAEFLKGLLLNAGVHALIRRSAGSDVPDLLAAGARDVLVDRADERLANLVLLRSDGQPAAAPLASRAPQAPLVAVGLLLGLALVAAFLWWATELVV